MYINNNIDYKFSYIMTGKLSKLSTDKKDRLLKMISVRVNTNIDNNSREWYETVIITLYHLYTLAQVASFQVVADGMINKEDEAITEWNKVYQFING